VPSASTPAVERDSAVTTRQIVLLTAAVVVAIGLRLWFFTGLVASDDLTHAYAGVHFLDQPAETYMPPSTPSGYYSGNGRRIGMNAPLYVASRLAGVSEESFALVPLAFSLIGVLVAFAVTRRLAGPLAGVTAAWLWAVLPVEVYTATIWMGDSAFATVLALFLLCFIAAELAPRRNLAWAAGAGVALGYMQYLKETAVLVGLAVVAWALVVAIRERRLDRRVVAVGSGWLAVQVVATAYFTYVSGGDPLFYWRATLDRYTVLATDYVAPHTFPDNWSMFWTYVAHQWSWGGAFPVLVVLAGVALTRRDLPGRLRLFLGVALIIQLWCLGEALKLGNWTQRYLLQATAPLLILASVGLVTVVRAAAGHRLVARVPERLRAGAPAALAVLLVVATALPLDHAYQQHGRARADVVRDAFVYLDRVADGNEPIYVATSKTVRFFTMRALRFLSGYRPWKGGFRPLSESRTATAGWAIMTHLEERDVALDRALAIDPIPASWIEAFRSEGADHRTWARVYRILPAPLTAPLAVVRRDVAPDVAGFSFQPVAFDPASPWTSKWTRGVVDERIDARGSSVSVRATAEAGAERSLVGLRIPVDGLASLRATLRLDEPQRIHSVLVYANGKGDEKRSARWSWRLDAADRSPAPVAVALIPGRDGGVFDVIADGIPADAIREVHVFVRLEPGGPAGFTLEDVAVAKPAGR